MTTLAWAEVQRLQKLAREELSRKPDTDYTALKARSNELKERRLAKYEEVMQGRITKEEFISIRQEIGKELESVDAELGMRKALADDWERREKALKPLVEIKDIGDIGSIAESIFVDDKGVRIKLKAGEFLAVG